MEAKLALQQLITIVPKGEMLSITGHVTTQEESGKLNNQFVNGGTSQLLCLSYNSTFGKNINPEKVEEMYKMLQVVDTILRPLINNPAHSKVMDDLQDLLTSAKL